MTALGTSHVHERARRRSFRAALARAKPVVARPPVLSGRQRRKQRKAEARAVLKTSDNVRPDEQ